MEKKGSPFAIPPCESERVCVPVCELVRFWHCLDVVVQRLCVRGYFTQKNGCDSPFAKCAANCACLQNLHTQTKKKKKPCSRASRTHLKAESIAIFSCLVTHKQNWFWWHATNFDNVIQLQLQALPMLMKGFFFRRRLVLCSLYFQNTNSAKSRSLVVKVRRRLCTHFPFDLFVKYNSWSSQRSESYVFFSHVFIRV